MKSRVHFTSERQNWKTPRAFFQALDSEFNFDFDPCPPRPTFNGLEIAWGKANYVNPPYSGIADWMRKAWEEHQQGKLVVMLIPSRTDTRWWHDYAMRASEIRFIKGRLHFDDQKHPAPFPSALVIFNGAKNEKIKN